MTTAHTPSYITALTNLVLRGVEARIVDESAKKSDAIRRCQPHLADEADQRGLEHAVKLALREYLEAEEGFPETTRKAIRRHFLEEVNARLIPEREKAIYWLDSIERGVTARMSQPELRAPQQPKARNDERRSSAQAAA